MPRASDWRSWFLTVLAFSATAQSASAEAPQPAAVPWVEGSVVPIAIREGRAEFSLPNRGPGAKTLVIVSTLARETGPFPVALQASPSRESLPTRLEDDGPIRPPASLGPIAVQVPPPRIGFPASTRAFHLLVHDGDPAVAGNYHAIEGRLRAMGERVQVYVDSQDITRVGPEVLRDLVATFDERVFPTAAAELGLARDVDADGRFTVLMSSWLGRLAGGKVQVDGFVRGADFDPELSAPFGNRCDMMYLSATLESGPHLRTVIAHEYTHAVSIGRKAFGADGRHLGTEEEGWLDEALAHLTEDHHGFSRSNLDYRVSAFLSRPERYRLVVEDYYAADLFRSHGNRGGTYLFLRWCADGYGPGLLGTLIRSDRRGVANLEAATGASFASLYRRWSAALFLSGLGLDGERAGRGQFRTVDLREGVEDWPLAGPRFTTLIPGGKADTWDAQGTTSHFALVTDLPNATTRVTVSGPTEARLQVSAVTLPRDMGRLDLSVRPTTGRDGEVSVRVKVTERDGTAVRLSALAWEPLVPAPDPRSAGFRHAGLDMLGIARAFGTSALPARESLASTPIRLVGVRPEAGPLVFKVVGTDAKGRRVAAWAEMAASAEGRDEPLADH